MSQHDVEALLAALKPAGLSREQDAEIVAAIRAAAPVDTSRAASTPVYRRPVPAWAAAAACIAVGLGTWHIRSGANPSAGQRPAMRADTTPAAQPSPRIHVQSDLFVSTPNREIEFSQWSPMSENTSESQS